MVGHDAALLIDDKGFGDAANVVGLADLVFGIEQNIKLEAVLFNIRGDWGAAVAILTDGEDDKILVVLELFIERLDIGISSRQGGHQVAQTLRNITLPRRDDSEIV